MDTYNVIRIHPGERGEWVGKGLVSHSEAYAMAVAELRALRRDPANAGTEVRMVRMDRWGEAHISGRMYVPSS